MNITVGNARFTSNSDDLGFSARVDTRNVYALGNFFGSDENCLNVTIVSSFKSPTLWAFATRTRSLEV